jgi:hypothetical protein
VTAGDSGIGGPSVSGCRFPDFLGIGAQKAGTTWLHRNLALHPDVWLPPVKEIHFFDEVHIPAHKRWTATQRRDRGSVVLRNYLARTPEVERDLRHIALLEDFIEGPASDNWYGRLFGIADPAQISGEFTPEYSNLPEDGIRHVLRLSPEVKLILSLRDPIERCWSHIRMDAKRRGGLDLPALERLSASENVLARSDYPTILANWKKFVPGDRILAVFMDDIAAEPLLVLRQVCDFLGVAFPPKSFAKASLPVHRGEKAGMPPTVHAILKERLRPVYDALAELYPAVAMDWASRHY